jgi:hypothetical protein
MYSRGKKRICYLGGAGGWDLKDRQNMEKVAVYGRTIFQSILKEFDGGCELVSCGSGLG